MWKESSDVVFVPLPMIKVNTKILKSHVLEQTIKQGRVIKPPFQTLIAMNEGCMLEVTAAAPLEFEHLCTQ